MATKSQQSKRTRAQKPAAKRTRRRSGEAKGTESEATYTFPWPRGPLGQYIKGKRPMLDELQRLFDLTEQSAHRAGLRAAANAAGDHFVNRRPDGTLETIGPDASHTKPAPGKPPTNGEELAEDPNHAKLVADLDRRSAQRAAFEGLVSDADRGTREVLAENVYGIDDTPLVYAALMAVADEIEVLGDSVRSGHGDHRSIATMLWRMEKRARFALAACTGEEPSDEDTDTSETTDEAEASQPAVAS